MKIAYYRCLLLGAIVLLSACSKKQATHQEKALTMANQVAEKLDEIAAEIESITDYDSVKLSHTKVRTLGDELVAIYTKNQGIKTDSGTAKQIQEIVQPASKRLEKARDNVMKLLADDLPAKAAILVLMDGLAAQFESIKQLGAISQPSQ